MKSKLLILALAIALVAAACNKSSNSTSGTDTSNQTSTDNSGGVSQTPNPTPTPPADSPTPPPATTPNPTPTPTSVLINMTSSGFSPSTITVKVGTTVVFQNVDSKPHWPASNPHPVHTDLPGFDALRGIAPGNSYSFTFTKVGTWGYHDHLAPSVGGKVIVTQ